MKEVLGVSLLALAVAACGAPECGPPTGKVSRVVDGDTVELQSGERLRYLGVDTPEISGGSPECYGVEAYAFNRALVEQREVELRYDGQCTDRFERLLAYVFIEGRDVNALLVERGYACALHIPPNGAARAQQFEALEAQAERARRGLWGFCEEGCP